MVKFDKQFFHHQVPEWKEFYLDYDSLIAILNHLSKYRELTNQRKLENPHRYRSATKLTATRPIEKDLLITLTGSNSDMNMSEEARDDEYNVIKGHLSEERRLFNKFSELYLKSLNNMNMFFLSSLKEFRQFHDKLKLNYKDPQELELIQDPDEKSKKDKFDESGFSTSWKRAYSELYNKSSWLHGFSTINKIASIKLLQKSKQVFFESCVFQDDIEHLSKIELEIQTLEKQTQDCNFITEIDDVNELRFKICQTYADSFCKGNLEVSKGDLENVLKGGITKHMNYVMFYLGVFISLLFMCWILPFISSKIILLILFYSQTLKR